MADTVNIPSTSRDIIKTELRDNQDAASVNRVLADPEVTLEEMKSLSPAEKAKFRAAITAQKWTIGDTIHTSLEALLVEAEKSPAAAPAAWAGSTLAGAPSVASAWSYLPDIQAPLRNVSKDTAMEKLQPNQTPKLADIETGATLLEKNISVWLLKAEDQWDEIQTVADPKEFENDFRGLANYLNQNKPKNILDLSRKNNMLVLTDLLLAARNNNRWNAVIVQWRTLYEHSDPQMRLNWIFDQIKDANNKVVDEANNGTIGVTNLLTGWISTIFTVGVPTFLAIWWLYGKTKIKWQNLPWADKSNSAFMAVWNDIFHGGTADLSKLPKESQQILDEHIKKEINTWRATVYTEAEFKDSSHEAYKELKRRQNLFEQHFKWAMWDTFVADLDAKTGVDQRRRLRELGAAVQGKERGSILRPINTVTSIKSHGVTVPLVWGVFPTSANQNVIKGKELFTMMKKWIPVEEVSVNGQILKVKPDELALATKIKTLAADAEKKVTDKDTLITQRETELRNIKSTEEGKVKNLEEKISILDKEASKESIDLKEKWVQDASLEKTKYEAELRKQRWEVISAVGDIATAGSDMKTEKQKYELLERHPLIKELEWKSIVLAKASAVSPIDQTKVAKAQWEFEDIQKAAQIYSDQLEQARKNYYQAEAKKTQAEAKKTQAEAEVLRLEKEINTAQTNIEKATRLLETQNSKTDAGKPRQASEIQADKIKFQAELDMAKEKVIHIDQALRDPRTMDALPSTHFASFKTRFDTKITNLRSEIEFLVSGAKGINSILADLHTKYPTISDKFVRWGIEFGVDNKPLKLEAIYEAVLKVIGKRKS